MDIDGIRHHQECASKEGEVVAEAVCLGEGGLWPHLQLQRSPDGNASVSLALLSPSEGNDEAETLTWGGVGEPSGRSASEFHLGFFI